MRPNPYMTKGKMEFDKKSMAKYLGSMKRFFPFIIIACILLLVSVILQIIAPQYLSDMTDLIANGGTSIDLEKVTNYLILLITFYLVIVTANYIANFLLISTSQNYAYQLRKSISEKINRLPLGYFDSTSIGDVLSRVTNDVDTLAQSLDQAITMVISSVFLIIGSLIGMFITSWQMALVALIAIPLMGLFTVFILKFASPMFIKRQEEIGKINGIVEEKYSGQLVIKLFNAEDKMNRTFDENNAELGRTMTKAQICGGLIMPINSFVSYFTMASVFLSGGLLLAGGVSGITFGTITAFTVYVNLFQSPLSQLAQAMNTLQSASAASKRVFDFLSEKEMDDETGKTYLLLKDNNVDAIRGEIDFEHVGFSYDSSREIIHDFSAHVKPGMKVAIVGPTGAGKTTMVNLLMRFYEINRGKITIDGVNIHDMPRNEIHDLFGMVLQDTWVFEGTLRDNLAYSTKGLSDEEIMQAVKDANLTHFVETLPNGLDYEIKDGSSISAGQRQLITICRAMLRKTPMMILDEATSNVDTRTEEEIQEAMDRLTAHKTSFVIAHRLSTIKNADLILVMKDGNIIEVGNHEELMKQNGFYASLYNSQFAFGS